MCNIALHMRVVDWPPLIHHPPNLANEQMTQHNDRGLSGVNWWLSPSAPSWPGKLGTTRGLWVAGRQGKCPSMDEETSKDWPGWALDRSCRHAPNVPPPHMAFRHEPSETSHSARQPPKVPATTSRVSRRIAFSFGPRKQIIFR